MSGTTRQYPYTVKATWWLGNRNYFIFMLRELSPVFMSLFLIQLICLVREALRSPSEGYLLALLEIAKPQIIAFNVVALLFSLLHAITWFQAATTVLPVRLMGKPFPPKTPPPVLVLAGNIGMMVVIAVGIAAVLAGS